MKKSSFHMALVALVLLVSAAPARSASLGDAYLWGDFADPAGRLRNTVLAAFDSATGEFKRVYLPYFGELRDCNEETHSAARTLCEQDQKFPALEFGKESIAFAQGDTQSFDISPDGRMLYARAITGVDESSRDAQRSQIVAIDTQTGKTTPLPISSYGTLAVSASGKYLLVERAITVTSVYVDGMATHGDLSASKAGNDAPRINVYTLPEGRSVRALPGDKLVGVLRDLP